MPTAMLVLGFLAFLCSAGLAGPNEGGRLILHYNASLAYTDTPEFNAELTDCANAVTEIPPALSFPPPDEEKRIWYAYVAFRPGSAPRVKQIEFAIAYTELSFGAGVRILWTAFPPGTIRQESAPPWPEPGSGAALVFDEVLTSEVNAICAFAGYGSPGSVFSLTRNPPGWLYPNLIQDDAVPPHSDEIDPRATIGFGTPGSAFCPSAPGACCLPDGACQVLLREACESPLYLGIHQGPGTDCEPVSCPQPPPPTLGACCGWQGQCVQSVEWACGPYFWMIGESCSPDPCAEIHREGACCDPRTGECVRMPGTACYDLHPGYEWSAGVECSPNPCGGPYGIGACCYAGGECRLQSAANCPTGDWHGDAFCYAVPCPVPEDYGACCMPDFGCEVLRQTHCETGEWFADQPCAVAPCAPAFGACCLENGQCVYAREESCPTGDWHADEVCYFSLCPQPPAACCLLPSLECVLLTEQECADRSVPGLWMGLTVGCEPDPCTVYEGFGACCTDTCVYVSQEDCAAVPGAWHEGVPCAPSPCPQPAVNVLSWGKIKTRFR